MIKKPVQKLALIGRDPRNPLHRRWALNMLLATTGVRASRKTEAEIAAVGMALPKDTKIVARPDKYPLVAEFFLLEEGLLFPDNVIAKCSGCSQFLQFRPHAQVAKTRWCCFCAVDHMLAEKTAEKIKNPQRKKAAPN
jgi:hypothetical protein